MKKLTFLIAILVAFNLNSQKKELRQVDKLISQSFFDEANSNLSEIQSLVLGSEDKYKADFYYFKSRGQNPTHCLLNATYLLAFCIQWKDT